MATANDVQVPLREWTWVWCTDGWEVNSNSSPSFLPGTRLPGKWVGPSELEHEPLSEVQTANPLELRFTSKWGLWRPRGSPCPGGSVVSGPGLPEQVQAEAFLNSSVGWPPGNLSLLSLSVDIVWNNLQQGLCMWPRNLETQKIWSSRSCGLWTICSGHCPRKSSSAGMKTPAAFYYLVSSSAHL